MHGTAPAWGWRSAAGSPASSAATSPSRAKSPADRRSRYGFHSPARSRPASDKVQPGPSIPYRAQSTSTPTDRAWVRVSGASVVSRQSSVVSPPKSAGLLNRGDGGDDTG